MTKKTSPNLQAEKDIETNSDQSPTSYAKMLSQIVAKIKDEPFLFVIAIVALLVGAITALAPILPSSDLRFTIVVIAFLAFVVIIGYFFREASRGSRKAEKTVTNAEPSIKKNSHDISPKTTDSNTSGTLERVGTNVYHKFANPPYNLTTEILNARQSERISMTDVMAMYYKQRLPNVCAVLPENISVLTKRQFLPDQPIEMNVLDRTLVWKEKRPPIPKSMLGSDIVSALLKRSVNSRLYNGFLYRILEMDGKKFQFCPGNYFDFLNSCECLSYELTNAIVTHQFAHDIMRMSDQRNYQKVISLLAENDDLIPIRSHSDPFDFRSRFTAFGTCALVVIKRSKKSPLFVLNTRSHQLSETPGLQHIIPAGTFQPDFQDNRFHQIEFSFTENIFREFTEELLDDHNLRGDALPVFNFLDIYSERGKKLRKDVIDLKNFDLLYLGLVVDPINLKPEILTVLMLHEAYLKNISGPNLDISWETQGGALNFYEFTEAQINKLLTSSPFVPTGKAHLWLVMNHFNYLSSRLSSL